MPADSLLERKRRTTTGEVLSKSVNIPKKETNRTDIAGEFPASEERRRKAKNEAKKAGDRKWRQKGGS